MREGGEREGGKEGEINRASTKMWDIKLDRTEQVRLFGVASSGSPVTGKGARDKVGE